MNDDVPATPEVPDTQDPNTAWKPPEDGVSRALITHVLIDLREDYPTGMVQNIVRSRQVDAKIVQAAASWLGISKSELMRRLIITGSQMILDVANGKRTVSEIGLGGIGGMVALPDLSPDVPPGITEE